jgi:hypothetical protein
MMPADPLTTSEGILGRNCHAADLDLMDDTGSGDDANSINSQILILMNVDQAWP